MAVTLQIRDETTSGERTNERKLDLLTERITVRELIRSRVYQEVKDCNVKARQGKVFRVLVRPTDAEETLNGYRMRKPRELDWQKQFDAALEAFERNGFLILVDNHQVERLDEEIQINPTTQVTFLKLVLLVGG